MSDTSPALPKGKGRRRGEAARGGSLEGSWTGSGGGLPGSGYSKAGLAGSLFQTVGLIEVVGSSPYMEGACSPSRQPSRIGERRWSIEPIASAHVSVRFVRGFGLPHLLRR